MQPTGVNSLMNLMPLIFIFIIFYFLLIRPQKQSQKEHQKMIQNLQKNDEVVTTGGVHCKIINVKEKTLILRIDENVKIEIDKTCVSYLKKA
ncbi:MAG: preprotein translocase subunit YajC [Candidatus Omnitrophota bacterium]